LLSEGPESRQRHGGPEGPDLPDACPETLSHLTHPQRVRQGSAKAAQEEKCILFPVSYPYRYAAGPHRNCTYLIVDALDECRSGLEQLFELIVQILSNSSSKVKWLVSSRHRIDIEEGLRLEKGKIELDLEENVQG
jgi:hypothetical protein